MRRRVAARQAPTARPRRCARRQTFRTDGVLSVALQLPGSLELFTWLVRNWNYRVAEEKYESLVQGQGAQREGDDPVARFRSWHEDALANDGQARARTSPPFLTPPWLTRARFALLVCGAALLHPMGQQGSVSLWSADRRRRHRDVRAQEGLRAEQPQSRVRPDATPLILDSTRAAPVEIVHLRSGRSILYVVSL